LDPAEKLIFDSNQDFFAKRETFKGYSTIAYLDLGNVSLAKVIPFDVAERI
jgi:hypothetical protein